MNVRDAARTEGKTRAYYTIDELLGEEIIITEDLNESSEIREAAAGKKGFVYFCVEVQYTEETKDIHLTRTCLRAMAEALAAVQTWKGQRIKIKKVSTEFETRYIVSLLGSDLAHIRVPTPAPAQAVPAQITPPGAEEIVLRTLRQAPAGLLDKSFWVVVFESTNNDMLAAMTAVGKLKNEGKIVVDQGTWRAT